MDVPRTDTTAAPSIPPLLNPQTATVRSGISSTPTTVIAPAFQLLRQGETEISVGYGTVNGVVPELDGRALSNNPAATITINSSVVVVLLATTEVSDADTFGDLIEIEVKTYPIGGVPESSFENPIKRIGTVEMEDGAVNTIVQEVSSSLELVRWFDFNVWVPGGGSE